MPDRLAFGRKGAPGVYQGRFRNDWEFLFWFQKPGASGFFAKELLKEEATHKSYHKLRGVRRPDGSMYQRESTIEVRHRGNWWEYGCVGNGQSGAMDLEAEDHPARWPFNLAWDLIRCFAPKDGRVCDPFCGAGTTGAAAIEHGCHFLGGDLLENSTGEPWAAIAHRILLKRTQQVKLF
jgi:DNA modification methylase